MLKKVKIEIDPDTTVLYSLSYIVLGEPKCCAKQSSLMNSVTARKHYNKQDVAGSLIFFLLPLKIISQINIKLNWVIKHFIFNLINPTINI